ncbi:MAG: hypothetical protein JWN93_731 [Hyphomicrobiales bacterium]|nr:hypothetical protein [Hyphomicrobiales bacterium]
MYKHMIRRLLTTDPLAAFPQILSRGFDDGVRIKILSRNSLITIFGGYSIGVYLLDRQRLVENFQPNAVEIYINNDYALVSIRAFLSFAMMVIYNFSLLTNYYFKPISLVIAIVATLSFSLDILHLYLFVNPEARLRVTLTGLVRCWIIYALVRNYLDVARLR